MTDAADEIVFTGVAVDEIVEEAFFHKQNGQAELRFQWVKKANFVDISRAIDIIQGKITGKSTEKSIEVTPYNFVKPGFFTPEETSLLRALWPYLKGRTLLPQELSALIKEVFPGAMAGSGSGAGVGVGDKAGDKTGHKADGEAGVGAEVGTGTGTGTRIKTGGEAGAEKNTLVVDERFIQKLFLYFDPMIVPSVPPTPKLTKYYKKRYDFFPGGCFRCSSTDIEKVKCPRCRQECFVCRECLKLGEARSCTPLFLFLGTDDAIKENSNSPRNVHFSPLEYTRSDSSLECIFSEEVRAEELPPPEDDQGKDRMDNLPILAFQLTPAQQQAYEKAREFLSRQEDKALIFALCGGGKTETVYGAVKEVILNKGKVLFATPRRDLTKELYHRLLTAFQGIKIWAFYGGLKNKLSAGEILVATTHQLYRFYRAFDLIILDEADAFPYRSSENLPLLLNRALKPGGKLIYISATPEKSLLKETRRRKAYLITIPARFHRKPAPLPRFVKISRRGQEGTKGKFDKKIIAFIEKNLAANKPVLIFVPTILLAETIADRLRMALAGKTKWAHLPPGTIAYSHSKDPKRDEKLEAFFTRRTKVLVSTTILERGITLEGVRVLVLFSQHEVFDDRALVQMAGRSGRTPADPYGEVFFVGEYITPDMRRARKLIKRLNKEAYAKGYIDE